MNSSVENNSIGSELSKTLCKLVSRVILYIRMSTLMENISLVFELWYITLYSSTITELRITPCAGYSKSCDSHYFYKSAISIILFSERWVCVISKPNFQLLTANLPNTTLNGDILVCLFCCFSPIKGLLSCFSTKPFVVQTHPTFNDKYF